MENIWKMVKEVNSEYSIWIKIVSICMIVAVKLPKIIDTWLTLCHKWNILKLKKNE